MANQTIYPFGTGGSLPSSIGIINDLTTGGVDKALSAQQGVVINEKVSDIIGSPSNYTLLWNTGNINNDGVTINTAYANKYCDYVLLRELTFTVINTSGYNINIFCYNSSSAFLSKISLTSTQTSVEVTAPSTTFAIRLCVWDQPSDASLANIQISYLSGESLAGLENEVNTVKANVINDELGADDFLWTVGNINGQGVYESGYANACTKEYQTINPLYTAIYLTAGTQGFNIVLRLYDSEHTYLASMRTTSSTSASRFLIPTGAAYYRVVLYDRPTLAQARADDFSIVLAARLCEREMEEYKKTQYFTNPILNINMPDPCITDGENGYFYMMTTGTIGTTKMYRSPNFMDWEEADSPFTADGVADCLADLMLGSAFTYWGPEIVKVGNKYNLYISKQSNPMLVFQSDHPYFGYEYVRQIITTTNGLAGDNIDACVRYDLNGVLWMVWGSIYGIYRQKLSADGLTLDSEDTKVHIAGKTIAEDNTRATVFEGAYLYRRKGYWYLFVSAGRYDDYTYCIKVGRCATIDGTFVDKDGNNMTDGYATTILSSVSGDTLYGPGHNGQIFTDKDNRTYMVFHSHYTGASSISERHICLQEIFWDENGWPYFDNGGKPQESENIVPSF